MAAYVQPRNDGLSHSNFPEQSHLVELVDGEVDERVDLRKYPRLLPDLFHNARGSRQSSTVVSGDVR